MNNIIEELKEKQRQRMAEKRIVNQAMRERISFSFAGIKTGYKSTDWRVK